MNEGKSQQEKKNRLGVVLAICIAVPFALVLAGLVGSTAMMAATHRSVVEETLARCGPLSTIDACAEAMSWDDEEPQLFVPEGFEGFSATRSCSANGLGSVEGVARFEDGHESKVRALTEWMWTSMRCRVTELGPAGNVSPRCGS